jgi:uncharacterized protein
MIRRGLIGLVQLYQLLIAPFLPRSCRFFPSCSQYMIDAICVHGPVRGIWLGAKRIVRCQPLSKGGFDFVPLAAEDRPAPGGARAMLAWATFAAALVLFPMGSDAMLASDGVWYGIELEADAPSSIRGNHPLFHVAAWPLAEILEATGIRHPGHWALRLLSASGAGVLAYVVAGLGLGFAGLAAAAYLLASRMFVIEAATGENVVPATAAALLAATAAVRHRRRPVLVGALLALALVLRQDNVLLVPGIAVVLLPKRITRIAAFLGAVAVPVAAVYLAAWRIAAPEAPLLSYVLGLGAKGAWSPAQGSNPAAVEADAIAVALVGRHWPYADTHALLGVAGLLLPLLLFTTRRSLARTTWEPWVFGLPIALRSLFYGWFEPGNPEWQLFSIAFVCAWAARSARLSGPRPLLLWRTLALGAAAAAVLAAHLPHTLSLRKPTFRDAVASAVQAAPQGAVLAVEGFAAPAMTRFMGLEATILQGSSEQNLARLAGLVQANEGKAVLGITDRFVLDAMPYSASRRAENRGELDGYADTERMKMIRRDGLAYAILILPERPASR